MLLIKEKLCFIFLIVWIMIIDHSDSYLIAKKEYHGIDSSGGCFEYTQIKRKYFHSINEESSKDGMLHDVFMNAYIKFYEGKNKTIAKAIKKEYKKNGNSYEGFVLPLSTGKKIKSSHGGTAFDVDEEEFEFLQRFTRRGKQRQTFNFKLDMEIPLYNNISSKYCPEYEYFVLYNYRESDESEHKWIELYSNDTRMGVKRLVDKEFLPIGNLVVHEHKIAKPREGDKDYTGEKEIVPDDEKDSDDPKKDNSEEKDTHTYPTLKKSPNTSSSLTYSIISLAFILMGIVLS